jgi:uncharacterized iron-regulated protein
MKKSLKLLAWSLGFLLLWSNPTQAQSSSPWRSGPETLNAPTVFTDLAQAQVIYLGETHDDAADHQAQLQIIQTLHGLNPKGAIALEMFQRPSQPLLDQYLSGNITETELQQQSEYDQRWGYPWEYYAPILRFAKEQQIPLIALNVPTEITRKVAREGLESLTDEERQWIPPNSEIRTDNLSYRQIIQEIYDQIHQGRSASSNFENFFLAQVLWDETMAQGIADFLKANPDRQIITLAGDGHIAYGYGIPSRVARRVEGVRQRSVILNPDEGMELEGAIAQALTCQFANYLWTTGLRGK